jgi:hypothetical protein
MILEHSTKICLLLCSGSVWYMFRKNPKKLLLRMSSALEKLPKQYIPKSFTVMSST